MVREGYIPTMHISGLRKETVQNALSALLALLEGTAGGPEYLLTRRGLQASTYPAHPLPPAISPACTHCVPGVLRSSTVVSSPRYVGHLLAGMTHRLVMSDRKTPREGAILPQKDG